ncbi:MAG: hypothetical protein QY327_10470 [Fimbriimonadaceae bacterium]|nr:MAG: hypothetical protein QY327_10470 [Fimbriimonadaceae bacterium]
MSATLEYELGQADMEAFYAHHATHAPYIVAHNRRMQWIWGSVFALLALVYFSKSLAGGFAFLSIAIAFVLLYGRLNRLWYISHNRRLNSGPDGPRYGTTNLKLADGYLLVEAPVGSAQFELSAIRRIDESNSHHFLYLGPASALVVAKALNQTESFINTLRGGGGAG